MGGLKSCATCCLAEMNRSVHTEAIRRALPVYFGFSAPWRRIMRAGDAHLSRCEMTPTHLFCRV